VLSNFRKHGQDRGLVTDPYSTAAAFDGWRRPIRAEPDGPLADAPTTPARTWMLTTGWRRGELLDPTEPIANQRG
jgi:hypothetical protein